MRTLAATVDTWAALFKGLVAFWHNLVAHVPYLVIAALTLLLSWVLARVASALLERVLRRTKLRESLRDLACSLIYAGVWVAGLLAAGMVLFPSLTPGRLLATLGLGSIAVGFAFKDIFENFFAGVMILWRFPIERGDVVDVDGVYGRVERIWIRMTMIRQPDGQLVVVPNSQFLKKAVRVVTNSPAKRQLLAVGVAYGTPLAQARQVIEQAIRACDSVDQARPVDVLCRRFGDSSVDLEVLWWSSPEPLAQRRSRDQVLRAVDEALRDAQIEIPFPQREVQLSYADGAAGRV